jgi:hypothetical protein
VDGGYGSETRREHPGRWPCRTTGPFHSGGGGRGKGKRRGLMWRMTSKTHWSVARAQIELAGGSVDR